MTRPVRSWLELARRPDIVSRSTRVALVVGTLLALINHGGRLLDLNVDEEIVIKICLTYLVRYCVSNWASVQTALRGQSN